MPASEHGEWIGSFSVGPWFTVGDVAEGIYPESTERSAA